MPGPISHIVLANKIYRKHFTNKKKHEFYMGTSFPDIRYLEGLERSKTHFAQIRFHELKNHSSFHLGFKLHSLIDNIWYKYADSTNIHFLTPKSTHPAIAVAAYKDQLLYDKVEDWNTIKKYFSSICRQQLALGVQPDTIRKWHRLLGQCFSRRPGKKDIESYNLGLGRTKKESEEIVNSVNQIKTNKTVKKLILDFYNNFENLIEARF